MYLLDGVSVTFARGGGGCWYTDGDEFDEDDEWVGKFGDSELDNVVWLPDTRWKAELLPLPMRLGRGGGEDVSLEEIGCSSYLMKLEVG